MCSSAALFFAIKAKGQENPSSLRLDSLILIKGWSLSAGKDSDFLKSEWTSAEHLLYTMWLISNDFCGQNETFRDNTDWFITDI